MSSGKWRSTLRGITCLLGTAGLATAQSSRVSAPDGADAGDQLAEVVVTAEKRAENLQRVPISVSAVNADTLQRQGVQDFSTLNKVDPSVVVTPNAQFVVVAIRGVRPSTFSPTSDSPDAVHVDGAYISRFTALQGLFFDLERVEVLAGPQGTLYGRNSVGGTVNLITARPRDTFSGNASLEYGDYNQIVAQGALNLPITDTLDARIAYRHYAHNGYFKSTDTDDALQDSVRLSVLWRPTSNDQLLITADNEQSGGKGPASNIVPGQLSPAGTPPTPTPNVVLPQDPRDNPALVGNATLYRQDTSGWGFMAQFDHSLDWSTLTFQAQRRMNRTNDQTGTANGWLQTVLNPPSAFVTSAAQWDSEELRLTSTATRPLQWVAGLYRFGETTNNGQNGSYATNVSNVVIANIVNPNSNDHSYAGFGQLVYTPTFLEQLHVTAGTRYNTEKKSGDGYTLQGGAIVFSYPTLSDRWNAVTYKVNVAYDLTDTSMVYGGVSTGFKSGGFAYGPQAEYQPEKITAYEVGSKNRFFDDTLEVNLSAWIYNYRNLVANITQPYSVGTQSYNLLSVLNAATAKNRGQTLDLHWLITRDDSLTFSGQHLHNYFGNFNLTYIPGQLNYSNTPVGYSPEWSGNIGYDHYLHVLGGTWDAQVAVQLNGDRLLAPQAVVGSPQDIHSGSYTTADASIRYQPDASKNWSITGYVRNFTDKLYLQDAAYVPNTVVPYRYNTARYGAPRTFGFIFDVKFGL